MKLKRVLSLGYQPLANNLLNNIREIISKCELSNKQKITSFVIDGENTGNGRSNVALMLKFISKRKFEELDLDNREQSINKKDLILNWIRDNNLLSNLF